MIPNPTNFPRPVRQPTNSGCWVRRWWMSGKVINADVNAAANTGRKYDERIFPEGTDFGCLYGTVKAMTFRDVFLAGQEWKKRNPGQTGQWACVCPVSA